jgi:nuclear transport factor 2 (NTF2) superfamily protein
VLPFDEGSARQKVKAAQDAWNTSAPEKVSLAYTPDSKWRDASINDYKIEESERKFRWSR